MQGKINSRKVTGKGVLFTILEGEVEKLCLVTPEQLTILNLMGTKVPNVGAEVTYEASVNPGTGSVSETWVNINL